MGCRFAVNVRVHRDNNETFLIGMRSHLRWVYTVVGHGHVTTTADRRLAMRMSRALADEIVRELDRAEYKVVRSLDKVNENKVLPAI